MNKTDIDGGIASATNVIANALGGDELKFVMEKDFDAWLDSYAVSLALPPLS